ncbi:MAG: DUF1385 domain-containing protein, partial [Fimbriimonas ginsengisoli]|nr:DUF1385 domain-containing protein [Fimbriimonas ginsengisoli]
MPQAEYLQYGGQAIVEGVMMRSPRHFAIACRAPNGQIVLVSEALEKTWVGRQKWLKLPFLRGSLALVDSLALGYKALKFASNVQLDPKYQPAPEDGEAPPPSQEMPSERVQDVAVGFALVAGLAIGLGLFLYLPNVLAEQLTRWGVRSSLEKNLVTEVIKITFFIGYLWGISRMPEVARMFMYHGAEHKAINTLEAEQELTLENCKAQTRLHPRCGTSFAIVVLLVSLLL